MTTDLPPNNQTPLNNSTSIPTMGSMHNTDQNYGDKEARGCSTIYDLAYQNGLEKNKFGTISQNYWDSIIYTSRPHMGIIKGLQVLRRDLVSSSLWPISVHCILCKNQSIKYFSMHSNEDMKHTSDH